MGISWIDKFVNGIWGEPPINGFGLRENLQENTVLPKFVGERSFFLKINSGVYWLKPSTQPSPKIYATLFNVRSSSYFWGWTSNE
jgi:hypothetical protein